MNDALVGCGPIGNYRYNVGRKIWRVLQMSPMTKPVSAGKFLSVRIRWSFADTCGLGMFIVAQGSGKTAGIRLHPVHTAAMRRWYRILLALLVVAIAGVIAWQGQREQEPVYQGKPLSVWLTQYGTNHWSSASGDEMAMQAEAAIRQIGSNAIPIYLRIITAGDSSLKLKMMALIPRGLLARLHLSNVNDYRHLGAYGLIALGSEAKHAVPALIALLNDKNPDVRYTAIFTLRSLGPVAGDAMPSLIKCLKDPDFRVQSDAILGFGQIHQKPQQVIPILVELLDTPHNLQHSVMLRGNAIWSLRQFGAQAKSAVPSLLRLLNEAEPSLRSEVTNALKTIDPEAAAKAGAAGSPRWE